MVFSAMLGASATRDAAQAGADAQTEGARIQERIAREGLDFQKQQADLARQDLAPIREAQTYGLDQLKLMAGGTNPLEQQQRAMATQQIQQQLASQGLLRSKSQVDLLSNLELGFNQQNQDRRLNILGMLSGTGGGQSSANILAGLGQSGGAALGNLGASIGSSFANAGNMIAQGGLQATQQILQGVQGTANMALGAYGGYQQNQLLKSYLAGK
jgi:hypothetical protein